MLGSMTNSIDAYDSFLNEGPGALQAVAVLYHGPAIFMALSDAVWNRLIAPFFASHAFQKDAPADMRHDAGHPVAGRGNPYLHSTTNDPDDVSVERLVGKGASFFVCHNALEGFGRYIAQTLKRDVREVRRSLISGVVPGALVVPAGVMAINACQEAKFTYIQASL